jgi:hypothetical protein
VLGDHGSLKASEEAILLMVRHPLRIKKPYLYYFN